MKSSFSLGAALSLLCTALQGFCQSLNYSGGLTAITQHANDKRIENETTVSADLFITRAPGSGEWLIYLEGNSTPSINGVATRLVESNADAGSALDEDRRGRVQVSELNYTLQQSNSSLTLGLIDPSAYLDRSRITNDENQQFIGAGFVNNPTIEFPDYSLGVAWQHRATGRIPEFNLVVSNSHGLADNPNVSYAQLLNFNEDDKGVFLGGGLAFRNATDLLRLGAWINTADHNNLTGNRTDADNYGIYAVLGHSVGNHAFNMRTGIANSAVSLARRFAAIAYRYQRGNNALGLGLSHTAASEKLDVDDSMQIEAFFRWSLRDNVHLTPSLQYLLNSGFDSSGVFHDDNVALIELRFFYGF